MANQDIAAIVRAAAPLPKKPLLTPEQAERLKNLSSICLAVIAGAGIVALSVVAPNIFLAIDRLSRRHTERKRFSNLTRRSDQAKKVARTFYYLRDAGFINMKREKGDFRIWLTAKGRKRFVRLDFETLQIPRTKKWDGKWWQVAADIPTKDYKLAADLFRRKLIQMKFYPLQRTLWLYPFDPRRELEFVANHYEIIHFVTVMEINRLDQADEQRLLEHFKKENIL